MSELENNSQITDKRIDSSNININTSNKINQMNHQPYKEGYDYNILKKLLSTELIDSLESNNGANIEKNNNGKLLNENIQNYGNPIHFEHRIFKENNLSDDNNNIYMNNESDNDSSSSNFDMDPDEFFKNYNLAIHKSNENNNIENKNDLNTNNGIGISNTGDDKTKNNKIIDYNNKSNFNPLSLGDSIENKNNENIFKFPINNSQKINPNLYNSYESKNKFSNNISNNQINVDNSNFNKTVNNNNDLNLITNNNNMNNNPEIQKEAFNSMNNDQNLHNDLNQINKLEPKDYLIRMFGKYGWICRICNNFNFETRNKCNRCFYYKLPKTLIEINKQKEENKKLHKKKAKEKKTDWICLNCNNLNYAFRKFCNRCQIERNDLNVLNPNNNNIYNLAYSGNVNEFGGEYNKMLYPSNNYNPNYINDSSYHYENENINFSDQSNLNKNNNIFPYISIFKK